MKLIGGMHRSGTSLVARVAHSLGANLGPENTFFPADRWNPDGYFEQRSIIELNSKLINGAFGRLSYFKLPSERAISLRGQKHSEEIRALIAQYDNLLVKENRFCLTLPVWMQQGLNLSAALMVFRDPNAVANSLWRRNRVPRRISMTLWYEHHRRMIEALAETPTASVWFDRLCDASSNNCTQYQNLSWFLGFDNEKIRANLQRMGRGRQKSGQKPLPSKVQVLYEHLQKLSDQTMD